MQDRKLKVFLSYANEQADVVVPIFQLVEAVGADCWFDKETLVGGDTWNAERRKAQADADVFLAAISKETTLRDGVIQREIRDALEAARDRLPDTIYLVPVRLEDIEVPTSLRDYHWIDFFSGDWKSRLARSLKKASEQRSITPSDALEVAAATRSNGKSSTHAYNEEDASGDRSWSYLQYTSTSQYWDYVNALILSQCFGELYKFRRMMRDWPEERQASYWEYGITEFHSSGELVSLTVGSSHYFGQTIHPNHSITTINIFGPECGPVDIIELFDHSPDAVSALGDYCRLVLTQAGQPFADMPETLDHYIETYGWDLFSHYNVNERGIIINFSASSGLPHVMGVFDLYVPWEIIFSYLPDSIRKFLIDTGINIPFPAD